MARGSIRTGSGGTTLLRLLPLLPLLFVFACSNLGVGGACHHRATGEVLTEIRDANGDLFRVRKMPNQPTFTGSYDGCGVPVEAETEDGFLLSFVFHPETGERLVVYDAQRGLRPLDAYEWY